MLIIILLYKASGHLKLICSEVSDQNLYTIAFFTVVIMKIKYVASNMKEQIRFACLES